MNKLTKKYKKKCTLKIINKKTKSSARELDLHHSSLIAHENINSNILLEGDLVISVSSLIYNADSKTVTMKYCGSLYKNECSEQNYLDNKNIDSSLIVHPLRNGFT